MLNDAICELGINAKFPHSPHTDSMTLDEAMASLEEYPFQVLEIWDGKCWTVFWNGYEEFTGVQPENL